VHQATGVKRSIHAFTGRKYTLVQAALITGICFGGPVAFGQDLAPRAYLITPTGANAVTLSYSFNDGSVFVDPSLPIEDLKITFQTQAISYYHSYNLWGRSANITFLIPYALGNANGTVAGSPTKVYRSGLADSRIRFATNLKGGPALSPSGFSSWQEKSLIGVSFTAVVPTGQYDPARVMNGGANRWAFKPEVGLSRRWGHWVLDSYAGAWFFTPNDQYFPRNSVRTQQPIGVGEGHLTFYARPRLWVSLDGNFWIGGRSTVNGQKNSDEQRNSRTGVTVAIPMTQHQSVKLSYAKGAYVRIGGNYTTISAAWQFSWLGKSE
jgi:hypothetical protein